jgi:fructose-specific PTS system IIB component
MSIVFVRIDDRLIHGQVATTWIRTQSIEQVAVINDELAKDPMQASVLKMAAPTGVKAVLLDIPRFIEAYNKGFKKRTMLILTNPQDVLSLIENGVTIPYLNVGGMKFKDGRKRLTEAVSVTEEDMEVFEKMITKGISVEIQMVPNSRKEYFSKYLVNK